jgi:type IV secretory pathway component VirB8
MNLPSFLKKPARADAAAQAASSTVPPLPVVATNQQVAPAGDVYQAAVDWDASRIEQIEKSEQRAWNIAYGACGLVVFALLAIVLLMPLKDTVPYVVRVNDVTGAVDVMTVLEDQRITYEEAVDKYWLAQFVRARETYDYYTLQHDYDTTRMLSSPPVGKQYTDQFEGDNALDKKLGKTMRITVDVISVSPDGNGAAIVRFTKSTARADSPDYKTVSHYVASIGYEYRNPSKLNADERLLNPLGFWVTSYRADQEFGTRTVPAAAKTASDEPAAEAQPVDEAAP